MNFSFIYNIANKLILGSLFLYNKRFRQLPQFFIIIINRTVRMQVKRSPLTTFNSNNKQTSLIQPFITISKASTPVRTRLIGATNQMNSTPVNISKIGAYIHKSPNNKENYFSNQVKMEGPIKQTVVQGQHQNRINLSPIMALNKKLMDGPVMQQKKSFIPFRSEAPTVMQNFEQQSYNELPDKNYQTLNSSKGGPQLFSNTTNFSNLRGSNSFKTLIEARCKTPNKLQNNNSQGLFAKKQSVPLLKESLSSNQLFRNFGKDGKQKLSESRSFDKFKPFNSNNSNMNEIKCMNNDGKKAKYRVANHDSEGDELYYCSKCTIPLVQQGFIVELILKDSFNEDYTMEDSSKRANDYRSKLQNKRNNITRVITELNMREDEDMSQLNSYYSAIMNYLQQQRNSDIQNIKSNYDRKRRQPSQIVQEIDQTITIIENSNGLDKPGKYDIVEQILKINQQHFQTQSQVVIQSQSLTNHFIQCYELQLRPKIENKQDIFQPKQMQSLSSRNNAMRFSFQKLLTDINTKKSKIRSIMNPLQQQQEQAQNEYYQPKKQEPTAFRDLFPQGEQYQQFNNDIHSPTFKHF